MYGMVKKVNGTVNFTLFACVYLTTLYIVQFIQRRMTKLLVDNGNDVERSGRGLL
jgi:hypothetical protein